MKCPDCKEGELIMGWSKYNEWGLTNPIYQCNHCHKWFNHNEVKEIKKINKRGNIKNAKVEI